MKKVNFKQNDLEKAVTLGVLLQYTDEFLLPKIDELFEENNKKIQQQFEDNHKKIQQQLGQLNHDLKTYIDAKLGDYTSDIFKRLDKKYQKEKQFKEKVVELFKKHKIGSPEDVAFLEGLVQGS